MTAIAISASGLAITMLYHTAIEQQTIRLTESAQRQVRLLKTMSLNARFYAERSPDKTFSDSVLHDREARELFKGFGNTGVFILAKRDGNQTSFIFSQSLPDARGPVNLTPPLTVPLAGPLPMQQALAGNSGSIVTLDYRDVMVLAAFEPVAELNLGIVAKMDMAEIRKPFLRAGILVTLATLLLVFIGTLGIRRIGNPLVSKLEENEQRLRAILDTAADGIITTDAQGRINSFNQAAEHIFGYSSEEAIDNNIATLIAEPYPYPLPNDGDQSDKGTAGHEREVTGLHSDGSEIPLEITVSEMQEKNAQITTSIVRDITERKQSMAALHQRKEELWLIFEKAPVGIYICTLNGDILRANHAFCSLLGYTESELLAKHYTDIIHSGDLRKVQTHSRKLLVCESDSILLEVSFVEKQGLNIPCRLRGSVIHDKNGNPLLYVAHIEDRSEQLKTEQIVREHAERLAHVTRLSSMGEMTTSIAHEINQPLSAIATYAAACQRLIDQDQPLPEEVQLTLGKIRSQALRAGDVIDRLRKLIRKRKGRRQQQECYDLITEVINFSEVDAHYHQVKIHKELEPDLPSIYIDSVQIQQVIINLLRNAIDSMATVLPPINKEISLRVKRHGDKSIEIAVIDRGTGLSPEARDQLFSPFFTTKPLGLGMGLSISRSIVNAHGGQLQYTANPEGGSVFLFILPINARKSNATQ